MANVSQPVASIERSSTQRTRPTTVAGLCYLAVIAGGLFAEVAVRQSLVVPGDAEATARAILANETLWRLGVATHLLYLVPALAVNVLVSGLFRATEPTLARLALVFGAAAVTVEAVALTQLYAPLAVIEGGAALVALGGTPASIYLGTRLFAAGFAFSLLLFAGFCIAIGALILRSRRLPRVIGGLMVLAGVCYVVNTLAMVLSPLLWKALNPTILLPILIAELSLALWLLLKGVTVAAR
jgi:hypothetical protein